MSKKLKTREALAALNAIQAVWARGVTPKLTFQFRRVVRELEPIAKDYEAAREAALDECVLKDEDGKRKTVGKGSDERWDIAPEKREEFDKLLNDVLDTEVEVGVVIFGSVYYAAPDTVSIRGYEDAAITPLVDEAQ